MASRLRGRWRVLLRPHALPAAWWGALAAALLGLDYITGPDIHVTSTFAVPILLAAWYSGRWSALSLAFILPGVHLAFTLLAWNETAGVGSSVASAIAGAVTWAFVGLVIARLAEHERELEDEVEALAGLLPICMHCKSIRNRAGEWENLETYLSQRTDATFTHGLCARCEELHYPELQQTRPRRTA